MAYLFPGNRRKRAFYMENKCLSAYMYNETHEGRLIWSSISFGTDILAVTLVVNPEALNCKVEDQKSG